MSDYVLSCESTADLSAEKLASIGVEYTCFHFYLDGEDHLDDLGKSVPFEEFYHLMAEEGVETKTAAIGSGDYEEYFRGFLSQGKDVLHCALSSGISSTYQSAYLAAEQLKEEFPERKLYVIDSLAASSGFGLMMQTLSDMRAAGVDIDAARDWVEANKSRLRHWFFSTDLTFFIKGGRVSPVSGYVGNLLGICPLLDVNSEGKLIPREKIRGRKKVIKRIVDAMIETAEKGADYDGKVFISHSGGSREDAEAVAKRVAELLPNAQPAEIYWIGTTIGSHTGPGTVALFFWGTERNL